MSVVRLGVVGCGAIAQIQHLPNLADLQQEFAVEVVCDRSAHLAAAVAARFRIPRHVTDYRRVLEAEVDAVVLCHSDPKVEVAVATLAAGKHVFIEKPLCYSLTEADAIVAAARQAGTVAQVGYMKVYDPAFEVVERQVASMGPVRFVQVNHLHTDNALHLRQFRLLQADDVPAAAHAAQQAALAAARRQALGSVPPEVERAFSILAGSMIHDLYGLRVLLGQPRRVVSTEIWNEGWGISTVLEYACGARAVATWVELPRLWDFRETLEVYGDDRRALLSYPTGFSRGLPSSVCIQGIDDEGVSYRQQPAMPWENPFARQLRHFHACITGGERCRTPVAEARQDVALIIDIVRAYAGRGKD